MFDSPRVSDWVVDRVFSGMAPSIRAVLSEHIGEKEANEIEIISNDVDIQPDGKWQIKYRHPSRYAYNVFLIWGHDYKFPGSEYGHDKSRAILPYRELPNPPTLFFFGDGVSGMDAVITITVWKKRLQVIKSDISAAKHADVLFVRQKQDGENDLASYCTRLGIRHILFTDFANALPIVESIVKGEKSVDEALSTGKA